MTVLCGIIRDCEPSLPKSLFALDAILNEEANSYCVLITNDNKDNTLGILIDWARGRSKIQIVNLDGLATRFPERELRLAEARNAYLDLIRDLPDSVERVVVLDMDGINDQVTLTALRASVSSAPPDWTALFANQLGPYYDLHALRCAGWVERSVWEDADKYMLWLRHRPVTVLDRLSGGQLAKIASRAIIGRYVGAKQYTISASAAPIQVHSAFGGLGIYRRAALAGVRYQAKLQNGKLVCEHVPFHAALALSSPTCKFYILPNLLNLSPPEHWHPGAGRKMPPKLLRRISENY